MMNLIMVTCVTLSFILLCGKGIAEASGSDQCPVPPAPAHGTWYCPKSNSAPMCHLECDPGYAPSSRTSTSCTKGSFSISPSGLTCLPAVALLTGGLLASTTVEVYGPAIHRRLPNLPDVRVGHTMDYVDSFIIACGGTTQKLPPLDPPPPSLKTCIQMKADLTWTTHSTMSYPRDIATSAVNLGQLNILGGSDNPDKRETIKPAVSDKWTEKDIENTKYTCGVKISPEEFMATGGTYKPTSALSYNVVSGKVTTLQSLSQARSGHGCTFIKAGEMVGVMVAGGLPDGDKSWTKDVTRATTSHAEFYDMKKGTWKRVGDLNMARRGLKLIFVQNALYAMGGFNGTNYVKTVEQFNFDNKTWSYAEDMLDARAFPGIAAIPAAMVENRATNSHLTSALVALIICVILMKCVLF